MMSVNGMTVRMLRQVIADLPDDTPVAMPIGDHRYSHHMRIEVATALRDEGGWMEDHGGEAEYGKRTTVLIVGG